MNRLNAAVLLVLLAFASPCFAHTDLQLQIAELTRQLTADPANTDLLMRRGDLHRRHQDWSLARDDFARVRQIEPDHAYVDWFSGRLEVEAGNPKKGVALLDAFLTQNPHHPVALQNRAQGYLLLGQPLPAAQDYQMVIQHASKPGPDIYGACASAYMAAGEAYSEQAMDVVRAGLKRIPGEVSLTGMGTDISLARADLESARTLIDSLPKPVLGLLQWKLRSALLNCQAGHAELAAQGFAHVIEYPSRARKTATLISLEELQSLAAEPDPENCRAASLHYDN